jgi:putative phage-type endonuclease
MKTVEVQQGTAEWKAARAGMITASRICDVIAKIKSGEAASRRDYKAQLVVERLTGLPAEDGYTNAAMQWGNEQEPFARAAYEFKYGVMVDQVGFVGHPIVVTAGASPDGLVNEDGLVEIKCPKTATHLQYILDGRVPAQYVPQMQWQMECTGRDWCDFVSYDPRIPKEHLQLFVARLHKSAEYCVTLCAEVMALDQEVEEMLARLPQQ